MSKAAAQGGYTPGGGGVYMPEPAAGRKNAYGKYDITTPKGMIDYDDNYVAVVTAGENRNPQENELIEHYARQLAGKINGTYDPIEDPPVVLRDLLPTVFVLINKVFTKHEVDIGGKEVIQKYQEDLAAAGIDFDIIPITCGRQALLLPLHALTPKQHRDKFYDAQMQGWYKQHTAEAKALMNRVAAAQKEAAEREKKAKEEAAARAAEAKAQADAETQAAEATAKPSTPLLEADTPKVDEAAGDAGVDEEDDKE